MKRILSKTRRKTMMVVFLIMLAGSFFTNLIASENSADGLFQGSTITGKVTTVDGEELPGVNIIIKGTTIGTVTDVEGNFIIDVPDEHLSGDIQVSFVGYLTETVSIAGQTVINVSLVPDLQQLEEVVVIGYGVQKKSDLTGAIASVSGEDLTAIPAIGVDQALQGRAAGVSVTSNTGMPGGGVNIQIRGISSINGTQPLVIVNGVRGNLNDLNPYDIESVEILKDASSAAIYGATGGNGVIIVKTKSGQKGKLTANFNYYRGWQEPWKKVDMMNKDEYIKTMNIITAQQAIDRDQDYVPFNDRPDTLPDYNWQDMMFRTAIMENYDFSVSGGSEKSDYYLSANYLKQEGIMRESDYERIGFRISSDHRLNKIIEVGENVTFTRAKNIGFEEWEFQNEYNSPMLSVLTMCPYTPQYDEDGEWAIPPFGDDNPQVWLDVLNRTNKNYTVGGLGYVDLNLFKGFVFTTKVNAYNTFTVRDQFTPYYQYSPTLLNDRSRVEKRITQQFGWELQTYANYNKTLADNHNIGLMAGHEASYTKFADIEGERIDLFSEVEEMWYFDASTNVSEPVQIVEGGGWERAEHAYFGRINYDYKGKYLLTFNIRKDYSSRFGPEYRSGVFPSFSAGWKFSEEPFIKNLNFISFGKLRAAYGETGANAPADYAYYASVHTALDAYNYPLDYSDIPHPGGVLARIPNREMHWETMVMTNFGIDLGFFNNTLSITADYFNKENDGMLIYQTLPGVAGMYQYAEHVTVLGGDARPISNIGKIVNKGAEFTVGYKKVIGELKASASVNFSFIENEVIDIKGDSIYSGTVHVNLTELCLTTEGYPVSQFNGYVTDGLFTWDDADINDKGEVYVWNQTTFISPSGRVRFGQAKAKPGDLRYVDANQDSSINDLDKRPIGNPIPKFIMGFSTNLEYKNFDLSMFFEGKFGQKIFNGSKWFLMEQELGWNRHTDVLNQYREPIYDAEGNLLFEGNTNTSLPRLDFKADNANFTTVSDFYVEDGSYLRLKNIQLGYTLPVSITGKAGIERLRIYGAIRNLLTITKYSGFDPEVGSRYDTELRTNNMLELGIDKIGNYPHNRMYTIGINLQF